MRCIPVLVQTISVGPSPPGLTRPSLFRAVFTVLFVFQGSVCLELITDIQELCSIKALPLATNGTMGFIRIYKKSMKRMCIRILEDEQLDILIL